VREVTPSLSLKEVLEVYAVGLGRPAVVVVVVVVVAVIVSGAGFAGRCDKSRTALLSSNVIVLNRIVFRIFRIVDQLAGITTLGWRLLGFVVLGRAGEGLVVLPFEACGVVLDIEREAVVRHSWVEHFRRHLGLLAGSTRERSATRCSVAVAVFILEAMHPGAKHERHHWDYRGLLEGRTRDRSCTRRSVGVVFVVLVDFETINASGREIVRSLSIVSSLTPEFGHVNIVSSTLTIRLAETSS
jgi:hypothetical protein